MKCWSNLDPKVIALGGMPTAKAVSDLLANNKAERGGFAIMHAIWAEHTCPLLLACQLVAEHAVP